MTTDTRTRDAGSPPTGGFFFAACRRLGSCNPAGPLHLARRPALQTVTQAALSRPGFQIHPLLGLRCVPPLAPARAIPSSFAPLLSSQCSDSALAARGVLPRRRPAAANTCRPLVRRPLPATVARAFAASRRAGPCQSLRSIPHQPHASFLDAAPSLAPFVAGRRTQGNGGSCKAQAADSPERLTPGLRI